jgi:hypothetical protein
MTLRRLAAAWDCGICLGAAPAPEGVDLLIRGGTIYNGSAAPFVGMSQLRATAFVRSGGGCLLGASG